MKQTHSVHEKVDSKWYLAEKATVFSTVEDLVCSPGSDFIFEIKKGCLAYVGVLSVDVGHLKMNGYHFYDLTAHYTSVKEEDIHEQPVFAVTNKTIVLVEGALFDNTSNIREKLEAALLKGYVKSLDIFLKSFTVGTDSAAFMAKLAYVSVSLELQTRMRLVIT